MKRKQRKSLPWRMFGYMILIIIKFGEVFLWLSPRIINALRSYIKHSKECFIRYPNTSNLVKKNSAAPRFFNPLVSVWISDETLFLVFDILLATLRNELRKVELTSTFRNDCGNKKIATSVCSRICYTRQYFVQLVSQQNCETSCKRNCLV